MVFPGSAHAKPAAGASCDYASSLTSQFRIRVPLNLPQPNQHPLFFCQPSECVANKRAGFRVRHSGFARCSRMPLILLAPPFRGTSSPGSEEIRTQRPPLRSEPIRTSPNLRKRFLHHVFRRLRVAHNLSQKCLQPRCMLPVKRVKCPGVTPADPLPCLAVVSQFLSPPCYSGLRAKRFIPSSLFCQV